MCGVAGVVEIDVDTAGAAVVDQLGLLRHRGPDSRGTFDRTNASIGQSRLAVIDLATGDPPILDETGTVGVAFNGEIYNYRQLRDELVRAGHTMKTEGDTEVIAHLAEDVDPVELCRRLDGMFAFAVWDERKGMLVLGRDRFGKKPLYYWTSGTRLVFGSEIKAVLADPHVPRSLDAGALPAYLAFGYVPTPRTFFAGVRSVPPGSVLTFTPRTGAVRVERYWRAPVVGVDGVTASDLTFDEAARETRRLLCDAVDRRLVADVPLGAFLSGGIDSSSVVAFMARLRTAPVRTFTIGFEDSEGFDERPYARQVAKAFSTDHTEFVVNPDKAEIVERLVWHHDQPFGDSSALPTYLLSELTKRHVTVALCGDGGDELFGGYERFAAAIALAEFQRLPAAARTAVEAGVARLGHRLPRGRSAQRLLAHATEQLPLSFLGWINYVPPVWRARLLHGADARAGVATSYESCWSESEGAPLLDRLQHLNLSTYLLDDLLPKVDRMSMAHGLEVRSPFLDTELAEFALRLPAAYKVRGLSLKRVLKAAVRDVLPADILRRRKRGFGVPLDRWFRTDLRPFADAMLRSPSARLARHVRHDAVVSLLDEHQSGIADHGHAVWALLTLEVFLRREGW